MCIGPTGDSRDRSGVSDEEANRRASAFADRLAKGDKLRMARIVPEAVKLDRTDEAVIAYRKYHASTVRREWGVYCEMVAKRNKTATAEEFANYMLILDETDIRAGADKPLKQPKPDIPLSSDEEFLMNESGGYPVLALGLLQFGRPERKQTQLTLHDVMDELHNYDELRLQAKKVFADLMAQTWEHFVSVGCGWLSGRYPTADYFRQYVLDWFNLDIKA